MVQRERRYRQSVWETLKGKEGLSSMSGVWGFYRGWQSGAHVLSGIQGLDRSKMRAQVSLLEPGGGLGMELCRAGGLEYTYDRSFSPGPSPDVISSREIIHSSSLTRSTCTNVQYDTCAAWGGGAGPSKTRHRKRSRKQSLVETFSFPVSYLLWETSWRYLLS